MSCAQEILYGQLASNITRTSTDFWPTRPESHGLHLYTNTQVSTWFGHFTWGDWDMFQSGHEAGWFHAAARAISGSSIYVSDKPESHNFKLLKKLVLADGTVLRCEHPGMAARDCLFHNPTKEEVLLKIFNHNKVGGVVGVFHAKYGADPLKLPENPGMATKPAEKPAAPISTLIKPSDIEGPCLAGDKFAIYAHNAQSLGVYGADQGWPITLKQLDYELFTVMPIVGGLAPIGLKDFFNSGGAVQSHTVAADGQHQITLRTGGGAVRFLAWAKKKPKSVGTNTKGAAFAFDDETGALEVKIPAGESTVLLTVTL